MRCDCPSQTDALGALHERSCASVSGEEVRVTSATGGQKGSKTRQASLVPPELRRAWLAKWEREGVDSDIIDAAQSFLVFETGASAAALEMAGECLCDVLVVRFGAVEAFAGMADVYGFGARKYSRCNYLRGYEWSLTQDAFWRHVLADVAGETVDPESGLCHLYHALWHVETQRIYAVEGIGVDDRLWIAGGIARAVDRERAV